MPEDTAPPVPVWSVKFFRDLRSLTSTRLAYISRAPQKLKLPIAPSNAWPMAGSFIQRQCRQNASNQRMTRAADRSAPPKH